MIAWNFQRIVGTCQFRVPWFGYPCGYSSLTVFLEDGDVPIDNSASEKAIRTFCLGKKNWMFHNTAKGASASAMVYSISETAKLNNLRPYYYFKYILTELPKLCDERGNIDPTKLDYLMPWSDSLLDECRKPRRS